MILHDLCVRAIQPAEAPRFQQLMQAHHYLGALPKIGETLWYVATWQTAWVALVSFSAAAWKCAVRDRWSGWPYRHQYDCLHLLACSGPFSLDHYRTHQAIARGGRDVERKHVGFPCNLSPIVRLYPTFILPLQRGGDLPNNISE